MSKKVEIKENLADASPEEFTRQFEKTVAQFLKDETKDMLPVPELSVANRRLAKTIAEKHGLEARSFVKDPTDYRI